MDKDAFSEDGRSVNTRPTSALDSVTRLNLLDIDLEKNRSTNKKCLIHRLIYVGRLNPELRNISEVGEHYENFVRSSGNFQPESLSGLLLVYPNYFVHIVEGPENLLLDLIEDEHEENRTPLFIQTKLIVFVNNIKTRLFSIWTYRVLSLSAIRMDGSKMQESYESNVSDALGMLYRLANELSRLQSKLQLKTVLDQLPAKFPNLLLPQDLIESLLTSKELLSLTEYKVKYMTPLHLTLDEELVWPAIDFPPPL